MIKQFIYSTLTNVSILMEILNLTLQDWLTIPAVLTVWGEGYKVWVYAIKDIKKGDELSYDYGFSFDEDFQNYPCRCGAKDCAKFIIREGSRWRIKKSKLYKSHKWKKYYSFQ